MRGKGKNRTAQPGDLRCQPLAFADLAGRLVELGGGVSGVDVVSLIQAGIQQG